MPQRPCDAGAGRQRTDVTDRHLLLRRLRRGHDAANVGQRRAVPFTTRARSPPDRARRVARAARFRCGNWMISWRPTSSAACSTRKGWKRCWAPCSTGVRSARRAAAPSPPNSPNGRRRPTVGLSGSMPPLSAGLPTSTIRSSRLERRALLAAKERPLGFVEFRDPALSLGMQEYCWFRQMKRRFQTVLQASHTSASKSHRSVWHIFPPNLQPCSKTDCQVRRGLTGSRGPRA